MEFEEGYRQLQKLVEGTFEMPYLFEDVDVVINDEGKINGMLPNRFLFLEGRLVDILFGNIVIVDSDREGNTISLSEEKRKHYEEIFRNDAVFLDEKTA